MPHSVDCSQHITDEQLNKLLKALYPGVSTSTEAGADTDTDSGTDVGPTGDGATATSGVSTRTRSQSQPVQPTASRTTVVNCRIGLVTS